MASIALDSILAHLEPLIAFDTRNGTGDEIACVEHLRGSLAAFNPDRLIMETTSRSRGKSDSGFVMAVWGQPRTLLNVHIDTVPSGEGWSGDPLKLRRDGDHYIGLGTSDIKGAAACILAALEQITPKDCVVLFSGDEEHGSEVMPEVIARGHVAGVERAIVCEPTSCRAGRAHRGMLAIRADFSGPGGHSSLADMTEKPLLKAASLAADIGQYGADNLNFGDAPFKGLCVNIGDIKGDGAYNVIPTSASLWVSMRPPPGDDVSARTAAIYELAKPYGAALDTIVALEPFGSKDVSVFKSLLGNTEIVDLPYWTEAALLGAAGVNTIVYGPGNLDQAHRPNEYVEGAQLSKAAKLYAAALSRGAL